MNIYLTKKIYIAGPLFNTHEKGYLEKISIELESNDYECFLPHRDQKGVTEEELTRIRAEAGAIVETGTFTPITESAFTNYPSAMTLK